MKISSSSWQYMTVSSSDSACKTCLSCLQNSFPCARGQLCYNKMSTKGVLSTQELDSALYAVSARVGFRSTYQKTGSGLNITRWLLNWNIVDLQHCASFRCTTKWFCFAFEKNLVQIIFPFRLLQNNEYNLLWCTVGHYWLSTLYIVVC